LANKLAFKNVDFKSITKHNFYGFLSKGIHRCEVCVARDVCQHFVEGGSCEILRCYAENLEELFSEISHLGETDLPLISEFIHANCTLMLLKIYYSVVGVFCVEGGLIKSHPVSKYESQLRNSVIRLSDCLGLSPEARRRLAKTKVEFFDIATRASMLEKSKGNYSD